MEKSMTTSIAYEGFDYEPVALTKYIEAAGLFSILLNDGKIAHFRPDNPDDFRSWLIAHGITDLRKGEIK